MMRPVDDANLLNKCQEGDEDALAELIRRYNARLYQLTLRVCGDRALAEEATVESFYKIWRKAHQWRAETAPDAWICRIAVRTVLDLQRGRWRWRARVRSGGSVNNHKPFVSVLDGMVEAERQDHMIEELERAIGTLKPEDRALVHLFYFEGRGLKEIAPVFDASADALKMRLARARKHLRRVLEYFDNE